MENNREQQNGDSPSAAKMMDYVQNLNGNIKFGKLGNGWFITGASNEHDSNNPIISLSKQNPNNPHIGLITKNIPWEEFKSWQEM